jgi:hypothetical protein
VRLAPIGPLPRSALVARIPRADGAGVRVHLAGGAVIVALGVVSVDPRASGTQGGVGLHRMTVRVCALSLCCSDDDRQRRSQNDLLHFGPPLVFLMSDVEMQYLRRISSSSSRGNKADDQQSNLDEPQTASKAAVENWISAIRKEEALASVNHSVAEVDPWENAGFQEDEIRKVVKEPKAKYEDALREKFFGFQ